MTLEPTEVYRVQCAWWLKALRDFTRILMEIDPRRRRVDPDEPDCVFRLRKVCHHAVAITQCTVDVDGMHAMTPELRAAYEQMGALWKCLPDEFRFEEDGSWWVNEARDGMAAFDHPTPVNLSLSLRGGGFADDEDPVSYQRLGVWLGRLGAAYALALARLARLLGTEGNFDSRLSGILPDMSITS